MTRNFKKTILAIGGVKNFMRKLRNLFLLVLAGLSLSGCGGSRNLTFSEVEDKMEYVLMSEDVKIEFYSIDKYGKFYYGKDGDLFPSGYFKARFDEYGNFVSYVVITSEEYFLTARGDNVYGEQQE